MEPSHACAHILWLDTVDSTNSELRKRISGLDNLSIVATREQTAGRGQGTHTWFATPGRNLTFSILYRFEGVCALAASDALLITQVTTLALRDYLLGHGVRARIKWPNDIWVEDRKICGILIENTVSEITAPESAQDVAVRITLQAENSGIVFEFNYSCTPEQPRKQTVTLDLPDYRVYICTVSFDGAQAQRLELGR